MFIDTEKLTEQFTWWNKDWEAKIILKTILYSTAGVPNLQDGMPDDLRWSWCNNNRNKVHSKCNTLESSWNQPPRSTEKLSSMKWSLVTKRLGTTILQCFISSCEDNHWTIKQNKGSWVSHTHSLKMGFARKDFKETFWEDENILYLLICGCQILPNWKFAYNLNTLLYLNFTWTILEK